MGTLVTAPSQEVPTWNLQNERHRRSFASGARNQSVPRSTACSGVLYYRVGHDGRPEGSDWLAEAAIKRARVAFSRGRPFRAVGAGRCVARRWTAPPEGSGSWLRCGPCRCPEFGPGKVSPQRAHASASSSLPTVHRAGNWRLVTSPSRYDEAILLRLWRTARGREGTPPRHVPTSASPRINRSRRRIWPANGNSRARLGRPCAAESGPIWNRAVIALNQHVVNKSLSHNTGTTGTEPIGGSVRNVPPIAPGRFNLRSRTDRRPETADLQHRAAVETGRLPSLR